MRIFTPDLYSRCQESDTAVMDAADAAWEAAEQGYEQHLRALGPKIEPLLAQFEGLLLHDAEVVSMTHQGKEFVLQLLRDVPPHEMVVLTYTLTEAPAIDREALPAHLRSGAMAFQYAEFDLREGADEDAFVHSILFSNGWALQLLFRSVEVRLSQAVYPCANGGRRALQSVH